MHILKKIIRTVFVSILVLESKILLKRMKPKIIAVTGSVGKTSTKDAIFSVVSAQYSARKSDKSFNSEIGLPLTILGLKNPWTNPLKWLQTLYAGFITACFTKEYPEWLVLEVGADHPGDIGRAMKLLTPDIGVLTAVPNVPVHVEYFPSTESVLIEKRKLIDAVVPGGLCVIDGDCEHTAAVAKSITGKIVSTFGVAETCTTSIGESVIAYDDAQRPVGMSFKITHGDAWYEVFEEGVIGTHLALPHAVAIAIAQHLQIPDDVIRKSILKHVPPPGRMRIIDGLNDSVLIDDTYNSSPYATEAAINTLSEVVTEQIKYAVLGDMSELGKHAGEEHARIGTLIAQKDITLVTVGARARGIAEAAHAGGLDSSRIQSFAQGEWDAVASYLRKTISSGDIVLLKGSQSTRLEKIVQQLLRDVSEAHKLVRQDDEWKQR
jgi:UDP-N-acetylmuramyl pentapeptide synthase